MSNTSLDTGDLNTDPPAVRCYCGSRFRIESDRRSYWATCRRCGLSDHDLRRTGLWWRFRLLIGY